MKQHDHYAGIKRTGITLAAVSILAGGTYLYVTSHTQTIVGAIQKLVSKEVPLNSYEPLHTPVNGIKENGQYIISEICYGTEYPNSFLDITYPDGDVNSDRPTLFYFHGGGYFFGSKAMGDPMAANDSTALRDDLCAQGYNIVNADYGLVPDCHFPVPLIQANQVFTYIMEHKDEYHLNMDKVIIMGSSAGAIMASQLGSIVTNPDYASLLGISPALKPEQVRALVIDDAPLDYERFTLGCKILVGNYIRGSIYLSKTEIDQYNNILHLNASYPPSILLGSEYRHDMNVMHNVLEQYGVRNILVDPLAEHGMEKPHCFVGNERIDPVAKEAFERLTDFLEDTTR